MQKVKSEIKNILIKTIQSQERQYGIKKSKVDIIIKKFGKHAEKKLLDYSDKLDNLYIDKEMKEEMKGMPDTLDCFHYDILLKKCAVENENCNYECLDYSFMLDEIDNIDFNWED